MPDQENLEKPKRGTIRRPTRRASDILPSGELWPDHPRRELDEILDRDLEIIDFGWRNGRYGRFAVILARMAGEDVEFTTACGGEVVCRKLEELKERGNIPIIGAISYNERYYDLN